MDLSVIIVNYNTKELTKTCIDSVIKNTKGIKYEFLVVDNGSTDDSVAAIRNSKLRVIKNKENLGFGKANNQGMKVAKGRYILLLNSDTVLHDNVLGELVSWMDKNPKVGIVSCALKNTDGTLQATGGYFPTLPRVAAWMLFLDDLPILGRLTKPIHPHTPDFFGYNPSYLTRHEQDWVTAAFFLIRSVAVKEIGYFDEDYFMYGEEVDLCFRAKNKGWKVIYLPKWSITHLGGASSTKGFPIVSEYKGIKIFYSKHMPSWQYPILRFFLKLGALARMVLFGLISGKEAALTYAKAFKVA